MTTAKHAKLTARYADLTAACVRLADEIRRNDPDTLHTALDQFVVANTERLAIGEKLDRPECMVTL